MEEKTVLEIKCDQTSCTYMEDGTCLEGVPNPLQCPHLIRLPPAPPHELIAENNSVIKESEALGEELSTENWLPLPDGYELSIATARRISGAQEARLVVLAGEPDAGKTTLIASLYEKLCEEPFASLRFAGSETLLAFERVCHLSRTSSEAEKPDTERTKGLDPRFFHLALQNLNENENTKHLLLADLSGEAYRRATDHTDDAKKLSFIKRSDTFVLLLDGERLISKEKRHEVFQRGLLLLRSLTETGMLNGESSVCVAFSKFDLIQAKADDQNTMDFLNHVKSEFIKLTKQLYKEFSIIQIASRPLPDTGLAFGYGLDALIRDWLKEEHESVLNAYIRAEDMPQEGREADMFLWRHFARLPT